MGMILGKLDFSIQQYTDKIRHELVRTAATIVLYTLN